jgi:hypothetical protein
MQAVTRELDPRFADGFVFRNGRVIEHLPFAERAEALEWAGIEDADAP